MEAEGFPRACGADALPSSRAAGTHKQTRPRGQGALARWAAGTVSLLLCWAASGVGGSRSETRACPRVGSGLCRLCSAGPSPPAALQVHRGAGLAPGGQAAGLLRGCALRVGAGGSRRVPHPNVCSSGRAAAWHGSRLKDTGGSGGGAPFSARVSKRKAREDPGSRPLPACRGSSERRSGPAGSLPPSPPLSVSVRAEKAVRQEQRP